MIIGLGCDLIGCARIAAVLARQGDRFLTRILRPSERDYCLAARDPSQRLAARWAAKEAAMKALGSGWAQGVGFTCIEVAHGPSGTPHLILHDGAATRYAILGARCSHLSLSHADGMAMAVVVIET